MPDDDPSIADETRLFRRINPHWIVFDKNRVCVAQVLKTFNDSQDGSSMSVFIEDILASSGLQAADLLRDEWAQHFVAAITAGWARQCGQGVRRTPTSTEPAHADVRGNKPANVRKKLAGPAEWIVAPPNLQG
jgi:hypothetical protein